MISLHLATALLLALFGLVTFIDLRTMRIPDVLNAVIVAAGLGVTWLLERSLLDAVIGAACGYIAIFALNLFYRAARGRDGMGLGDAKLLAGAGAWLGWMGLPFVALLAAASGIIYVAARRIGGQKIESADALAFGPFLCFGILIVWLVQAYA